MGELQFLLYYLIMYIFLFLSNKKKLANACAAFVYELSIRVSVGSVLGGKKQHDILKSQNDLLNTPTFPE